MLPKHLHMIQPYMYFQGGGTFIGGVMGAEAPLLIMLVGFRVKFFNVLSFVILKVQYTSFSALLVYFHFELLRFICNVSREREWT